MTFISIFLLGLLISVAVALVKGDFGEFPVLFFILIPVLLVVAYATVYSRIEY